MSDHYILAADGKTPVACDLMTWARAFEDRNARRVAATELPGGIRVSTVFLGLDHSFGEGPPILWETMIFGGNHDEDQWRYSSYDDAIAGHERAVQLATAPADASQERR